MLLASHSIQFIGPRREQEDRFLLPKPGRQRIAVADGMGGHLKGAQAAEVTIQAFTDAKGSIKDALLLAEERVRDMAEPGQTDRLPGATAIVVDISDEPTYRTVDIGWAGDCRAYLWQRDRPLFITPDHTLSGIAWKNASMEPGLLDTLGSRQSNQVLASIGAKFGSPFEYDLKTIRLPPANNSTQPEFTLFVMSDGAWDVLPYDFLLTLMQEYVKCNEPPLNMATALSLCLERAPLHDNATLAFTCFN